MHDTTVGKSKSVAPSTVEYQELEQGQPSPSTKTIGRGRKTPSLPHLEQEKPEKETQRRKWHPPPT
jgi:hypothetical protein